jgi:hypothetical protein
VRDGADVPYRGAAKVGARRCIRPDHLLAREPTTLLFPSPDGALRRWPVDRRVDTAQNNRKTVGTVGNLVTAPSVRK